MEYMVEPTRGQFKVTVSDDIIADVFKGYFNKSMFRQRVEVIDLMPSEDGFVFLLQYERTIECDVVSSATEPEVNGKIVEVPPYGTIVPLDNELIEAISNTKVPQEVVDEITKTHIANDDDDILDNW